MVGSVRSTSPNRKVERGRTGPYEMVAPGASDNDFSMSSVLVKFFCQVRRTMALYGGQHGALPPPPVTVDNEQDYRVEGVSNSAIRETRLEFL